MTRDELVAAARHAATLHDRYPTDAHPPDVIEGEKAATVRMLDHSGRWIVCVHPNDTPDGEWYVVADLPPRAGRAHAILYADTGL